MHQENGFISKVLAKLCSYIHHIVLHVGKDSKTQGPRQIHQSSFPFIFPVETPEGGQHIGVVNHSALGTTITPNIFQTCIIADLKGCFLRPVSNPEKVKHQCKWYGHRIAYNIKDQYLNIRSDCIRLAKRLVNTRKINEHCKNLTIVLLTSCIGYVDPFELQHMTTLLIQMDLKGIHFYMQ